jgi:prophage maintenance system killer protein
MSRRTDKNIGVSWFEIPVRLRQMLGDVRAQIEHQAYSPVEIAARYHHRLVAIHVFPNGNGRRARLMADLLLTELAGRRFEWGRGLAVESRSAFVIFLGQTTARAFLPAPASPRALESCQPAAFAPNAASAPGERPPTS